ncbi:MAG: HAD family phosphatase [Dehalococcoidia bacterium]|nr:HAD family phosphatase [Dehalococcoidia bacterium]
MPEIRAAIFDIGGVLTVSPVHRIINFCSENGIPEEVRFEIFAGHDGLWSRFERSEFSPVDFASQFDELLSERGCTPCGEYFMQWFFQGFEPRQPMIDVVNFLRGRVKLGSITNNVSRDEPSAQKRTSGVDVHSLFDVVVESAIVGMRKPEPRIYEMTCELLGVHPHEAVFLDDLGANLKGAKALGMTTIKVDHTWSAIDELEAVLGFPLPKP